MKAIFTQCHLCGVLIPGEQDNRVAKMQLDEECVIGMDFVCLECVDELKSAVNVVVTQRKSTRSGVIRDDDSPVPF
jgi:hypothetical protein